MCKALVICLLLAAAGVGDALRRPRARITAAMRSASPGGRPCRRTRSSTSRTGAPYQAGGDWLVDRTTTVLPLCNYINASGNYSLRSYSLSPEDKTERVAICRGSAAVAPYAGPCPPK